jgi:hypothetical protein
VPLLAEFRPQVDGYLKLYDLHRTREFLKRYEAWKDVTEAPPEKPARGV